MTAPDQPMRSAASVGLFLAHALRLENEAVERYQELMAAMTTHNQPDVADLFREMAGYAALHRDEIKWIAADSGEPVKLAPWEYDWGGDSESPEAAEWDDIHYLMTPRHALILALGCERKAHDYYARVADASTDEDVARLARTFAEEEAGHAALLEKWLIRFPAPAAGRDHDPDPPVAG